MLYVICHVAIPDVVRGDTVIELCRFVRTPHYKYKYDVLVLHYQKISNYSLVTLLSRSSYTYSSIENECKYHISVYWDSYMVLVLSIQLS